MAIRGISRDIQSQIYLEAKNQLQAIIKAKFAKIKNEMIAEFESHPVTIELDGGPNASNISGTLGRGNLFSFIGFDQSAKPTEVIRQALMNTEVFLTRAPRGHFNVSFTLPTKEDLFSKTPLPWATGRSWLKGIEHGLSGLGKYMYGKFESGRSGTGIQSKRSIGMGKFKNTKYISQILNRAETKMATLDKGLAI